MSPGRLVRCLLGERASRIAGDAYRALFVDLDEVAQVISSEIPSGAHVLDVGGGDGALVDRLLGRRADIRVTTIDIAPVVGQWIGVAHARRVVRLPRTTLAGYVASGAPDPDVLLMTDVMHHIPGRDRDALFACIVTLARRTPALRVIVKDVEPGHFRAKLGYLSDRYVTRDRHVDPVSRSELVALMKRADGAMRWFETALFARDRPNYALVFWRQA